MDHRSLALKYIDAFCRWDLRSLEALLAEDLRFVGPFMTAESRSEYLDALASQTGDECTYRILRTSADQDGASVFWIYEKPEGEVIIAQYFGIENDRISDIRTVFDPGTVKP